MLSHQCNTLFSKNSKKNELALYPILDNQFPYLPLMVELNHLYPNNKIVSDKEIESIRKWFSLNKERNIFRSSAVNEKAVIVVKLLHPTLQQSNFYAIYSGIKPKSYRFIEHNNQQQINKWTMYLEMDDVKKQLKYTVIDSLSGKTISDIITSDQLTILKKLRHPYQIHDLQKIDSHILQMTFERGHTYQKKILGSGGYGTVRLMQNLETGEWCALKKMPYSKPDVSSDSCNFLYNDEKELEVEMNNLALLNLSLGGIDDLKPHSKQIKFVGMKLIPGMNLSDFKDSNPELEQIQWLNLFVSLISCALKFYQSGFLHLDIKPENVIYNKHTNEMSFVDFGFLASGNDFKSDYSCGTDGYIPPEFDSKSRMDFKFLKYSTMPTVHNLHFLDAKIAYLRFENKFLYINKPQQLIETISVSDNALNELDLLLEYVTSKFGGTIFDDTLVKIKNISDHAPSFIFNEKSVVYSIGLIIAEMLDLDQGNWSVSRVVHDDDRRFIKNKSIKNPILKREILNYLKGMTNYCNSLRPTLTESLQFFKSKILQLPELICHTRKIGILNIAEYLSFNTCDRLNIQDRLKWMNEIWFIDRDRSYSNHYLEVRRELEKAGINIGNHIFSTAAGLSERKLLRAISKMVSSDAVNAYFYITNSIYHPDKIASFHENGICVLFQDKMEHSVNIINDYLRQNTLLSEQYNMLIFLLSNKKESLCSKYGETNWVVKSRIDKIETVLEHFKQCHEKNLLSHALIDDVLNELSSTLLSTSTHLMEIMHTQNAYAMNSDFSHSRP